MRIAIDSTPLTVPHTGIGRYTAELARHLGKARPEAEVVLLSGQKYQALDGPPNLRCDLRPARMWEHRWWSAGLPLRLRKIRATLFHGPDFSAPFVGSVPAVITIHDLSPFRAAEWRMPASAERIARRLPGMAARARAVIVPSERVREEVVKKLKLPREKVFVTPLAAAPGFGPQAGEGLSPVRCPYILFVGTIEPRKNLVRLLNAFARLKTPKDLKLVMAGRPGWGQEEVTARIAALGLESRVILAGEVSHRQLAALYGHARVFVYPSLYEGFGLPVVEAMACGAPVVTSRDTACAEVAGEAAYLVDPHKEEEIAQGLGAVLEDQALGAALRRKGLERAAQFSWTRTAELTWQVYENALSLS